MRYVTALTALAMATAPLGAQEGGPSPRDTTTRDTLLLRAIQLASEGQGDSARAIVRRRLATTATTDSLYPEILYTAGVIAGDADSAMLHLRRVSIEYSRSRWADQALLRLAQLAFATRDFPAARRAAERIIEDYPNSDVMADAGFWAGRAHFEQGNIEGGCQYLVGAEAAATTNVELANRIRYYRQRCSAVAAAGRDTIPRDTGQAGQVLYSVQVAAVNNAAAADNLQRQLAADGFDTHIVNEAGLFKIRVGRFAVREDAAALVDRLKRAVGGTPFIVEER